MKGILGTLKGKILLISGGVLVTAAVVIGAVFLLSKENSYRSIAVNQLEGTTIIKSKETEEEAYKGMHLNSGDDVKVQKESNLTLLLDADKYLYAEAGTHFEVECVDGDKSGKKVIHLKDGSVLNRLETALKDGEIYEVETPNATMAVRGTVFRVSVYRDEDGLVHTRVEVFDGKVQVDLRNENGDYNGISETFGAGESAAIIGNTEFAEFVTGEEGSYTQEIAYKELPQDVAKILVEYIDDGEELCIGKELLMDYTELSEHKMETREGKEATCTEDGYKEVWCVVCNEVTETITIPATGHTMSEWEVKEEPTCDQVGNRQRSCTVCKTYIEEEPIEVLGHTAGDMQVVREASCKEDGLNQQLCTVCKDVLKSTQIAALGHSYGAWSVRSSAGCTTTGTEVRKCARCGAEDTRSISARGHKFGGWSEQTVAGCTTAGANVRTCSRCGGTETQSIAALGHKYGAWSVQTAATCTKTGFDVRSCSVCGVSETQESVALGHLPDTSGDTRHREMVYNGMQQMVSVQCVSLCMRDGCGEDAYVSATVRQEMSPDGSSLINICDNCNNEVVPD